MIKVNFIKLKENAVKPTYGTEFSAGADLYACEGGPVTIKAGGTVMFHTGIAMEIPEGYAGLIYARSGIASKRGIAPANKVGVIDCDYRGEIMIPLHNHTEIDQTIEDAERIAQIIITPYLKVNFCESEALTETVRGQSGFGSTGKK